MLNIQHAHLHNGRRDLTIGTAPHDEEVIQVQDGPYLDEMRAQAIRFRKMLDKLFPQAWQYNCKFKIKRYSHDFGPYFEVVIEYEEGDEYPNLSEEYALFVEGNTPRTWRDNRVREFKEPELKKYDNMDQVFEDPEFHLIAD